MQPPSLDAFQTRSDPVLNTMREAAEILVAEIHEGAAPRWLTLWGTNGTGKTFLGTLIVEAVREKLRGGMSTTPARRPGTRPAETASITIGPRILKWAALMEAYQNREDIAARLETARRASILMIDDAGAEHITPATLAKLASLLDARLGKWTVITTNLSPDDWKRHESRIASRFIRGGSTHVNCSTIDFSTRRA